VKSGEAIVTYIAYSCQTAARVFDVLTLSGKVSFLHDPMGLCGEARKKLILFFLLLSLASPDENETPSCLKRCAV
jgi:hypothetical protein